MNRRADVRGTATLLSDPAQSEHPCAFPADSIAVANASCYSWWAESEAQELFILNFESVHESTRCFSGQN